MKFIIIAVLAVSVISIANAKSAKKTVQKDESVVVNKKILGKSKPSFPRALIAIEIVDPNENSTKSGKNSKRTINSHLGYGYQQNINQYQAPKYEVYKYSQHDIPPYKGPLPFLSNGIRSHNYDIQKSVSYDLSPVSQNSKYNQAQDLNNYYQPGTTLFSTINNKGQLDSLSQTVPNYGHEPQVPVLILRVYPSQLADPSAVLHPNLPKTHPLAATLNNVDLHSLLQKYIMHNVLRQQFQTPRYQVAPVQAPHPQQSYHQPSPVYYNYHQQPSYQYQQPQYYMDDSGLLTHENYPKDTHTRVIFRKDKINSGAKDSSVPIALPKAPVQTKTIKIHLPPGVEVQPSTFSQYHPQQQTPDYYDQPKATQQYYFNNQGNSQESYYHMEQPISHQEKPNHQNKQPQYQQEQSDYQQEQQTYQQEPQTYQQEPQTYQQEQPSPDYEQEQPGGDYHEQESSRYQYEEPSNNNYDYSRSIRYERTQEQHNYEKTPAAEETTESQKYRSHRKRKSEDKPKLKAPQVTESIEE